MNTNHRLAFTRMGSLIAPLFLIVALVIGLGPSSVLAGNTDTPLHKVQTYGLCSDTEAYHVAVAGVGMAGKSSGVIHLTLPTTATVVKATLYWTGRDPFDGGDGTVRFQGNTLTSIQTGGPAFWGTNDFAFAYKSDVTSLVSPSVTSYTLEDPYSGDSDSFSLPYGAALVVVYKDSAVSTATLVETWEGMDIALGSSAPPGSEGTDPVVFQFDPAALPRTVTFNTVVGGIASGTTAQVYYIVGSGTPPSGNIFSMTGVHSDVLPAASDGNIMTTESKSVTVPAGATWLAVQVRSADTGGAQLHWIAETFQMEAACPKLNVTKTLTTPATGLAHVGDTVTFQVAVKNTGNTTLVTVPMTDTFNTTYLTFSSASVTPTSQTPAGTLTWDDLTTAWGNLAPGMSKTLTVTFQAAAGTQSLPGDVTVNTATVNGAEDQNGRTPPEDDDTADVEISQPSFTLTKTRISPASPDDVVTVGEHVVYQVKVTNTGDTALVTVPLHDTFDGSKLSFVSATLNGNPTTPDSTSSGSLLWNDLTGSGSLAPGASLTLNITLKADASTGGGLTTNTAAANGVVDENNETLPNKSDTASVRITQPAVLVTKTLVGNDVYVPLNGQVTYRITVKNTGDTVLETVPVTDTFPTAYLDYVSATVSPTAVNEGAGTISWTDLTGSGSLSPGNTVSVDVTFKATASSSPDTIINRACVENATDENGDHPANGCDDETNVITTHPSVTVTKTRMTSSPTLVGDPVKFQIVVKNTGNTTLVTLPLSDTFDGTKLTYAGATPSPDTSGSGSLSWTDLTGAGSLAPNASITITVNFTATASTTPGTTVNTATVSGAVDEHGDTPPDASDTAEVQIITPASIGDRVWLDKNGNGIQDSGEVGLDGVIVQLYNSGGTLLGSTTTASGGKYLFDHLFPGSYYVKVTPPSGYRLTAQDQGSNDALDSDADPTTGQMATTTLTEGEHDLTWDAGLYKPSAIGNFVWEDVNGNGIQDPQEAGIGNVTVKLHGAGPDGIFGNGDDVSLGTHTDANGFYTFSNLAPGKYYLEFVPPSGWAITLKDQGTDDNKDSDASRTTTFTDQTTLISGETDNSWDAGLYRPASIGDFTWVDSNANKNYDSGESPLPGVTLTLYDASGHVVTSTLSNSSGIYTFDNLLPGVYTVKATVPSGYVATTPTSQTRTLHSGDAVTDADFGFISPTAVSIESFTADLQSDGIHVTWRTMDESGVTDFRLLRALTQYGPWTEVDWVAATGSPIGATYSFVDHNVQPGYTYYYRLEADPTGTILGPWSVYVPKAWDPGVGAQSDHQTFLPFVSH